jgi:hypothetical protein
MGRLSWPNYQIPQRVLSRSDDGPGVDERLSGGDGRFLIPRCCEVATLSFSRIGSIGGFRSASLRPDAGRFDDRPPPIDLGLVELAEILRRLLLAWAALRAGVRKGGSGGMIAGAPDNLSYPSVDHWETVDHAASGALRDASATREALFSTSLAPREMLSPNSLLCSATACARWLINSLCNWTNS